MRPGTLLSRSVVVWGWGFLWISACRFLAWETLSHHLSSLSSSRFCFSLASSCLRFISGTSPWWVSSAPMLMTSSRLQGGSWRHEGSALQVPGGIPICAESSCLPVARCRSRNFLDLCPLCHFLSLFLHTLPETRTLPGTIAFVPGDSVQSLEFSEGFLRWHHSSPGVE